MLDHDVVSAPFGRTGLLDWVAEAVLLLFIRESANFVCL